MKAFINIIKKAALYAGLLIIFSLLSCSGHDDDINPDINPPDNTNPPDNIKNSKLKIEFAKGLLSAMKESKMLRDLLKKEALRMFTKDSYYKDYDLLYNSIKNKPLENNLNVDELIVKHLAGDKEQLDQILSQNPTLTILVPELPEESFSADLWDTENQIPAVAIPDTSGNVPFIRRDGTEDVIPKERIPGFPILVIKDDERGIISKKQSTEMRASFQSNSNENTVEDILSAYKGYQKAYENEQQGGWQRDYFYYGITPLDTIKSFNNKWGEHITSFSIEDGKKLYYSYWTEGTTFEFRITANINDKNSQGIRDNQVINNFAVRPNDLFDLTYQKSGDYYVITGSSSKTIDVYLPLFAWDLHKYSSTIKISVEEVDSPNLPNEKVTERIQFATNFSFNPKKHIMEKIGLQFGGNKELETKTITHYAIDHSKSSFLGEADINFGDPIIGDDNTVTEYSAGICKFKITPVKNK